MMRWWLDRGVDGFRMDVINMISKDPALPDAREPGAGMMPDGSEHFIDGPRIHEFLQEMHREVFAGRAEPTAHRRRDARRHGRGGAAVHRPGARRGRHGLPVRARRPRPGRDEVGRRGRCGLTRPQGVVRALAGRASRRRGWNSLYWNNHDQPRVVSRFGDDGPEHRVRSAKMLATVLHLHRGTPYVYQGEELGMTNAPLRPHRRLPRHRVAQPLRRGGRARATTRTRARRRCARWAATTRARRCSGTRASTPASPPASRGSPVNPNYAEINAEAARADPDSVFHHYRRLIELRHTRAGRRARRLHDAAAGRRARLRVHAPARTTSSCSCSGTSRARTRRSSCREAGGELVLGNYADAGEELLLRPWEARVLRRAA